LRREKFIQYNIFFNNHIASSRESKANGSNSYPTPSVPESIRDNSVDNKPVGNSRGNYRVVGNKVGNRLVAAPKKPVAQSKYGNVRDGDDRGHWLEWLTKKAPKKVLKLA